MSIIEKFSFLYIYKLILNNIIFRSALLINFLLLTCAGVDEKISSNFITASVLLLIIYSFIKAKKKVEHLFTLSLNLFFIYSFWYIIGVGFNIDTAYLFIGSYVLLGFDDFDLSGDVVSRLGSHLHNKCIGYPGGPGGNGGPDFSPILFMNKSGIDWEKYNNYDDRLKLLQNNPALDNYKEYIKYEDLNYKVSSIEIDIKEYNEKIKHTRANELFFEKQEIEKYLKKEKEFSYHTVRAYSQTPLDLINDLQNSLYENVLEYNTLKKAKLYYENDGPKLSQDYKDAFEIWQKRQIAISLNAYYKLKVGSLKFDWEMENWFRHSTVYNEIIENLLWVELHLIKTKTIYDGLNATKFNYFKLGISEFDSFVRSINKSHMENYKESYSFLNKYNIEKVNVQHMSRLAVESYYKELVLPAKEYYHDFDYKLSNKKVGLELSEKFSKRQFTYSDFKIMSKNIFSKPNNK